jgi:hypothetical protein
MSEQETEIGSVMTYYSNIGVAAIDLTGNVKVGDTIIIRGYTTDVEHVIDITTGLDIFIKFSSERSSFFHQLNHIFPCSTMAALFLHVINNK